MLYSLLAPAEKKEARLRFPLIKDGYEAFKLEYPEFFEGDMDVDFEVLDTCDACLSLRLDGDTKECVVTARDETEQKMYWPIRAAFLESKAALGDAGNSPLAVRLV
jgi:hypothetical protein